MKKATLVFATVALLAIILGFFFLQGESEVSPEEPLPTEAVTPMVEKPVEAEAEAEKKEEAEIQKTEKPKVETVVAEPKPDEEEVPTPPPEVATEPEKLTANTCFISVRCDTILKNKELLPQEKWELVPSDGKILATREVKFSPTESAFDVLYRVLVEEKIHIEFMKTTAYNSVYIEGIANIYEMDCGKLSGWMYMVNGAVPSIGSSSYQPQVGDRIEWVYTCDAGRDLSNGKGIE